MKKNKKGEILFRADGNHEIGLGHVIRSLALAEMLRENFECRFVIYDPAPEIKTIISRVCDEVISLSSHNIDSFLSILNGNEIVVLDGYDFNQEDQKQIRDKGCKLAVIDDLYLQHMYADLVINHALTASASRYKKESYTKVIAGSKYILLRDEFNVAAKHKIRVNDFKSAFICFGGSDKEDIAYNVVKLAAFTKLKELRILLGSQYIGDLDRFNTLAQDISISIEVYRNLGPAAIIDVMRKCDIAIVSASSIAYECNAVGLPIVTGYYLEHQKEFYEALVKQQNVTGINNWLHCTREIFCNSIESLERNYTPDTPGFVDGNQKERYIELFTELAKQ